MASVDYVQLYNDLKKFVLTEKQLELHGYPRPDPSVKGKAIMTNYRQHLKYCKELNSRICSRCCIVYKVNDKGEPVTSEECKYHCRRSYKARNNATRKWETIFPCCEGTESEGCCQFSTHVSENFNPNNLQGFLETSEIKLEESQGGDYGIYALDCEMCYTTQGNEITSITVVDSNASVVYQKLVLPDNPIIDYNTRFSGITEKNMQGVTINLSDVQKVLFNLFNNKTILIGHGLDCDLYALRLCHKYIIDTAVVFPHKKGPPYKSSLRHIAKQFLERDIQGAPKGHNSAEDAIASMDLVKWKVKANK